MANQPTAPPSAANGSTTPSSMEPIPSPASDTQVTARQAEGSLIGRIVTLITPFFAVLAGAIAGWVAKEFPGVHLDPGQIVAFMVTAATAALTVCFKFLSGWQQHEQNVADGRSPAIRGPAATKPPFDLLRRIKPEN